MMNCFKTIFLTLFPIIIIFSYLANAAPKHTCLCENQRIQQMMNESDEYQCVPCEDRRLDFALYDMFEDDHYRSDACRVAIGETIYTYQFPDGGRSGELFQGFFCHTQESLKLFVPSRPHIVPGSCHCRCSQTFINLKKPVPNWCMSDPCKRLELNNIDPNLSKFVQIHTCKPGETCHTKRSEFYYDVWHPQRYGPNLDLLLRDDRLDDSNLTPNATCGVCVTNKECLNGGRCLSDRTCRCDHGTSGPNCSEINPCIRDPITGKAIHHCEGLSLRTDRGVCERIDNINFKCNCKDQFYGDECEFRKQCNPGVTCIHADSCTEIGTILGGEDFECLNCHKGWSGKKCDFENECLSNNGRQCSGCEACCKTRNAAAKLLTFDGCDCSLANAHGDACEFPNKCIANVTCGLNGACKEDLKAGEPTCICNRGFSGLDCSIEDFCETIHKDKCNPAHGKCNSVLSNNISVACDCDLDWGPFQSCDHFTCDSWNCDPGKRIVDTINLRCDCNCTGSGFKKASINAKSCSELDACATMRCNLGTCSVDNTGKARCNCDGTDYKGDNCEIDNKCVRNGVNSNVCGNGICTFQFDGKKNYSCSCFNGWYPSENDNDDACSFFDPCVVPRINPCKNAAPCIHNRALKLNLTYSCRCSADDGWQGINCDIRNSCISATYKNDPCINGKCKHIGGNSIDYSCDCFNSTFYGDRCEFIDACVVDNSCLNGGICNRLGNTKNCTCVQGFSGENCEFEDVCITKNRKDACQHGATCERNGNGDYKCICSPPYFGRHCHIIDRCVISPSQCHVKFGDNVCFPCQNNGICDSTPSHEAAKTDNTIIRKISDFTCDCSATNFVGRVCSVRRAGVTLDFPKSIKVGEFQKFKITLRPRGDKPVEITVDLGEFKFNVVLDNSDNSETWTYEFNHRFRNAGPVTATVVTRNGNLFSGTHASDIIVVESGFCLPKVTLINCGHEISSIPNYKRKSVFVVTTSLDATECDPAIENLEAQERLKFEWQLFQLTNEFPTPRQENQQDVEKMSISDGDKKFVKFLPFRLNQGLYWIEVNMLLEHINGTIVGNSDRCFFRVEDEAPSVQMIGGNERTVPLGSTVTIEVQAMDLADNSNTAGTQNTGDFLEYSWSYIQPPIKPNRVQCGTFSRNCGRSKVIIEPNVHKLDLTPRNSPYIFNVVVKSDYNQKLSSIAQQRISVIQNGLPVIIECIKNCDKWNINDIIRVRCSCPNCNVNEQIRYSLEAPTSTAKFVTKDEFIVQLNRTVPYDLKCIGRIRNEFEGNSTLSFQLNTPPTKGSCAFQNNNQNQMNHTFLIDKFRITCSNFNTQKKTEPLTYLIYAKIVGKNMTFFPNGILLFHDVYPVGKDLDVPSGLSEFDYQVVISIKVVDSIGGFTWADNITMQIQPPSNEDVISLVEFNLLDNFNSSSLPSIIKRKIRGGDDQCALQIMTGLMYSTVGFVSNNSRVQTEWDKNRQNFLENIGNALTEFKTQGRFHSSLAIYHIAQAHYFLCSIYVDENMSSQTLETCKKLQEDILHIFKTKLDLTLNNIDDDILSTDDITTLARTNNEVSNKLIDETTNRGNKLLTLACRQPKKTTMDSVDEEIVEVDEIEREYFLEESDDTDYEINEPDSDDSDTAFENENTCNSTEEIGNLAKIAQDTFGNIAKILDAAAEREVDRFDISDPTSPSNGHGSVQLVKTKNISNVEFKNKNFTFNISGGFEDFLDDQGITQINVEMIETDTNIYFDDLDHPIDTSTVTIILKDPETGNLIPLPEDLTLDIFIPWRRNDSISFKIMDNVTLVNVTEIKPSINIKVHKLLLPAGSKLDIEIETIDPALESENGDLLYSIVALEDESPTREDFCVEFNENRQVINPSRRHLEHPSSASFKLISIDEAKGKIDEESGLLTYYVGIWAHLDDEETNFGSLVIGSNITYNISFSQTSCLIRDDNKQAWDDKKCEIGNLTTNVTLHCRCSHLSIFAGSVFIPPNSINIIQDIELILGVDHGPVILSTLGAILSLYIILLVVCFLLDIKDKTHHAGLTIMTKIGEDFEHAFYIINVITGSRFFAGTTANVSIQLYGSNGRSEAYVIKDPTLQVLNRGGNDSFLVSSKKELGNLEKIRVWHDNSGPMPGWYLRKVIVQNIKTNQQWYFFIENWLSLTNEDDPSIIREIPVAGPKEPLKWSRRFKDRLVDEFNNTHIWFSIFLRYPTSNFTRCQRLTVALAILTSYMLINIMFAGFPTVDIRSQIEFGDITFNILDLVKALQITLLAFPFGFILARIFQRIRQRYIPTLIIWKNRAKYTIQYNEAHFFVPNDSGISKEIVPIIHTSDDNSMNQARREFLIPEVNVRKCEAWVREVTKGRKLNLPNQNNALSDKLIRGVDDDGNTVEHCDRNKSDKVRYNDLELWAILESIRKVNPSSFIFIGENDNRRLEELIEEEIQTYAQLENPPWKNLKAKDLHRINDEMKNWRNSLPNITPVKIIEKPNVEDGDGDHVRELDKKVNVDDKIPRNKKFFGIALELYEMPPVSKKSCYFPWWFVYIAWTLCILIILVCSYFTLIYGLRYGRLKTLHWVSGFFSAWAQSLFIIQPFTIFLIVLIFSVLFRKIHSTDEDRFQILFKQDGDDIGRPKPLKMRIFHPLQAYPPLSGQEIFRIRIKSRRKNALKRSFISIIFHMILMTFLFFIANSNHSPDQYDMKKHLEDMLEINNIDFCPLCVNELDLVVDEETFGNYLRTVFLPAINPIRGYDNRTLPRIGIHDATIMKDQQTLLVGVPRIRQLRIKPQECQIPRSLKILIAGLSSVNETTTTNQLETITCTPNYSPKLGDNETYNPDWKSVTGNRTYQHSNDVWKYRPENETLSLGRKGKFAYYDGGGYVAELGKDFRRSRSVIGYLNRTKWIDERTRGIFIEFVVFNPNLFMFADITLTFERSPATGFSASSSITPIQLTNTNEDSEYAKFIVACYIIVSILIVVLCFLFMRDLIYNWTHYKCNLFSRFWLWADLLIILVCSSALGVAVYNVLLFDEVKKRLEGSVINQYVSFQQVASWNFIHTTMFALSLCLCMIKLWKLLVLSFKRFYIMSLTLKITSKFLIAFLFMFSILILAFAMLGNVVFGTTLIQFHSFGHSFFELMDQLLSPNFYDELKSANRLLGPIFYFVYGFFICCIGLNIFIALLNQGFLEAKEIAAQKRNWLTYWTYLKKAYFHFFPTPRTLTPNYKLSIPPKRFLRMKTITLQFIHACLKERNVVRLSQMRADAENFLQGSGFCLISKVDKWARITQHMNTSKVSEFRMNQMRILISHFIKAKKHLYFTAEEFKKYSEFGITIVKLKYRKIDTLMDSVVEDFNGYLAIKKEHHDARAVMIKQKFLPSSFLTAAKKIETNKSSEVDERQRERERSVAEFNSQIRKRSADLGRK